MDELLKFAQQNPIWCLQFLLVYLGNPVVFLSFIFTVGERTLCGIKPLKNVGINEFILNFPFYMLVTFPLYLIWFWTEIQILLPALYFFQTTSSFSVDKFCTYQTSLWSMIWAIPGILTLLLTSITGMEGNAMGFFFFPILLLSTLASTIVWIINIFAASEQTALIPLISNDPTEAL